MKKFDIGEYIKLIMDAIGNLEQMIAETSKLLVSIDTKLEKILNELGDEKDGHTEDSGH